MRTEINFLSHLFDRPTIEKGFSSNMPTHKAEISRNLAEVNKEKENNKYENQTEVL